MRNLLPSAIYQFKNQLKLLERDEDRINDSYCRHIWCLQQNASKEKPGGDKLKAQPLHTY